MEEETKRAIEDAIISAHLKLAHKIINRAARDVKPDNHGNFAKFGGEAQAFFASEGFLWLLQLIGCESGSLEDIAGQIAMRAFGL